MWSQIILSSRNWARLVWVHCKSYCHLPQGPRSLSIQVPIHCLLRRPRTRVIESSTGTRLRLRKRLWYVWLSPLPSLSNTTSEARRECEPFPAVSYSYST